MTTFLMQDYAGGTIQRYRGRYRHVAQQRIADYGRAGWPASAFVIVEAKTLAEAHAKAQPILLARKANAR